MCPGLGFTTEIRWHIHPRTSRCSPDLSYDSRKQYQGVLKMRGTPHTLLFWGEWALMEHKIHSHSLHRHLSHFALVQKMLFPLDGFLVSYFFTALHNCMRCFVHAEHSWSCNFVFINLFSASQSKVSSRHSWLFWKKKDLSIAVL